MSFHDGAASGAKPPAPAEPSRRNGEYRRSVMSALAVMVAAAVPSLVSSTALAERVADGAAAGAPSKEPKRAKNALESKKVKKTAKRASAAHAPRRRCVGTTIALDRVGLEGQSLALVDCHDEPIAAAQAALSVL